MGLPKLLTEQQKKFCELLVYNEGRKTPTECAKEAGYAEGSCHVRASELRNPNKFPLVVKYIGELRSEVQQKYEVSFEKHVTELGRIREEALAKGAFSAAANAEVARGKAAGLYIEQKMVITGKLEDLSVEQLEAKMKKIYEDNKVLIEGDYQEIKSNANKRVRN
jgi:phage terminase small subunit|tara:strand:+ start:5992 stop:6486 length:495 start_codon:yes stop_codon:yes gene_type:complete